MANKSFSKLTSRNQSALVSQLHKLINYYSSIFCSRERIYLKNLTKVDGSVYWIEDEAKKLMAIAVLDPNYRFNVGGIDLVTLGHTISNKSGQMERLLHHIFTDFENTTLNLICKPFVADSIGIKDYDMVSFNSIELKELFPELAALKTDYFNVTETLAEGLARKEHQIYFRFCPKDLEKIQKSSPNLFRHLTNKLEYK
jgi:hypothetical protein